VSDRRSRGLEIGLITAVTVALVGLISGVRGTGREVRSYVEAAPPAEVQAEARSYADMRGQPHGPNAAAANDWFDGLQASPDLFAPVVQPEADRAAALARRAGRRAFDGAPPAIPHRIDQIEPPGCRACHDRGVTIAGAVASRMSHRPLESCVQCHVVDQDPRPDGVETPPAPETRFVGLASPTAGERAWTGAPPTIPHSTRMRERCDACHGVLGATGMRSTHPWRASCTQCHAPSATLDQRAPAPLGRSR
jgi:cytochrome c-type protein NapB